jgi:hypothetical protein
VAEFDLIQGGYDEPSMSFAVWRCIGFTALYESRICTIDLGSIQGFVKDPSGAMVPGAKVTLRNNAGLERTVQTTDAGYFAVASIPAGLYAVSVEASGFKKYESRDNKLDPSASLAIEVTLTVGAASETVEVTATAVALQTESGSVQRLVTRQQIDALELNDATPSSWRTSSLVRAAATSLPSVRFSQGPSNINGTHRGSSSPTMAPRSENPVQRHQPGSADVDSTQEIQILTANYASEYGRLGADPHHFQTGGQQFHGAAYDYVRNLSSTPTPDPQPHHRPGFSSDKVPHNVYNQFGYSIGGPFYIPGN